MPAEVLLRQDLRDHIARGASPTPATLQLWLSWLEKPRPSTDELAPFLGINWIVAQRTPRIVAKRGEDVRCIDRQTYVAAREQALKARAVE